MGWWQVSADTLAGSRFVISPLSEAIASLMTLDRGTASHPGERVWLDAHQPAYRERLAGDPVAGALMPAAFGGHWIADFLAPAPAGEGEPAFGEELVSIRETTLDAALADLTVSSGGPPPAVLHRSDLPERAADLLEWVWAETVLPYWARRSRILEADIVARTAQLSRDGWAAALAGLRPGMRWLGEGRLQINAYDYPPREISGAQLLFVPVTMHGGWVSWDMPRRYAVIYPCSGALAEAGRRPPPLTQPLTQPATQALAALLGPGRAALLVLLDTPKSTTQLVALTGLRLGSVGRHLKVLFEAGLLRRRRAGRSVLYYRSAAGEVVVSAASTDLTA